MTNGNMAAKNCAPGTVRRPKAGPGLALLVRRLWRWYVRRKEIQALLSYDTRLLRDIGLTHDDVRRYAVRQGLLDTLPEADPRAPVRRPPRREP